MKYSTPIKESIEGKVVSLFIKEGQAISEGQVIYEVEVGSLQVSKKEKDKEQAKRVGISVVKGQILAIAVKLTAALGMAIALLYQVQWRF